MKIWARVLSPILDSVVAVADGEAPDLEPSVKMDAMPLGFRESDPEWLKEV